MRLLPHPVASNTFQLHNGQGMRTGRKMNLFMKAIVPCKTAKTNHCQCFADKVFTSMPPIVVDTGPCASFFKLRSYA